MLAFITVLAFALFCRLTTSRPLASVMHPGQHNDTVSDTREYIVIVDKDQTCGSTVLSRLALHINHTDVRYVFTNVGFSGFVASIRSHCQVSLSNMTDVLHVEEVASTTSMDTVRISAPWGLQRISSAGYMFGNPMSIDYEYSYTGDSLGSGVDIYILDTGINTANKVFDGRARMGWSFETDFDDHDGHGTHVSGTAAGETFGIASGATLIGVKVLGDDGSGSSTNTIAGIDHVISQHEARKAQGQFGGSIMSMSWGLSSQSPAIQTAINAAIERGIHVSIAAGNSGGVACATSPSMAGGSNSAAVVVGSIDEEAMISSFSNTGSCVDVYAPGENVLSAWIGGENVVQYLSGTSMACPHVTGVMAYLMAQDGSLVLDPATLKQTLLNMSLKNVVSGKALAGDRHLLLNNGMTGQQSGAELAASNSYRRRIVEIKERQRVSML